MVKTMFSIIFFLFISFLSPYVFAIEFTPINPETILFESLYENWNETAAYQPKMIIDKDIFYMFYTSANNDYQKIGYAISTDGLHWKRTKLYDFNFSENIHSPSLLSYNGIYTLTFAVDANPRKIMSVESSRIDLFENATLKEVIRADTASEGTTISDPNEFIDNNQRKLWYVGNNGSGWYIHLAYYEDNKWKKCSNNPVFSSELASPSFFQYDKVSYLFFHSYRGIDYVESPNIISCSTSWTPGKNIVTGSVYFPNVVMQKDTMYLYYNLFNGGSRTVVKTPIYKETRKKSVILIPGLFASWNKDAILHKKQVNVNDWKLNPMVTEYTGIENTLINLGYEKNTNYFVFAYDWRKPIEQSADDLSNFIKTKSPLSFGNWNIVGHSLGGLVGKIAIQKNNDFNTDSLITVGSPHLGAAQTYKPLSGGEIDRENTFMWLAEKVIIALYKSKIETDRVTISSNIPSLQDLLPVYNFLFEENGDPISYSTMSLTNTTLNRYMNASFDNSVKFTTISGKNLDTPYGFTIVKPSIIHSLLGNYKDGQPIKALFNTGDRTVLYESSSLKNTNNISLSDLNHGQIITTKTGIKTILDKINIAYTDEKLSEGKQTILSPSLIFLIRSSAIMQVIHNEKIFDETDGMIFIPDAESGLYTLKVKGIENGPYKITVGQISETDDIWDTFDGIINNSNPPDQIDSYTIDFNTTKLISVLTPTPTPISTIAPTVTNTINIDKESKLVISCTNNNFDAIIELKIGNSVQKGIKVSFM